MRRFSKIRQQREPTIALINIVFLMLVFFMVAGTLAPPLDASLKLVQTAALEGAPPADALVVYPDGRITHKGVEQPNAAAFVSGLPEDQRDVVRLVPDRALPAQKLVTLTRELRIAGAKKVVLVTQKGVE